MKTKWLAGLLGFFALFTTLSTISVPSAATELVGPACQQSTLSVFSITVKEDQAFSSPAPQHLGG